MTKSLTLVGCGSMGSALLDIFLRARSFEKITVVTPNRASVESFQSVHWQSSEEPLPLSDVYILAVKPNVMTSVLERLKHRPSHALIITVAAALPLHFYEKIIGKTPLVRLMPNTPCRIGQGIVLAIKQYVDDDLSFLNPLGHMEWMTDEVSFDKLATLTGCGPAFVYYFMECLTKAVSSLGLNHPHTDFLTQTLLEGSLTYLKSQGTSPTNLRHEVTSPNGTTAAGLSVLMKDDTLQTLLSSMLRASLKRTRDIQHDLT